MEAEQPLADQLIQIGTQGSDVRGQFLGCLLKGYQDVRLAEVTDAPNDEFYRQE